MIAQMMREVSASLTTKIGATDNHSSKNLIKSKDLVKVMNRLYFLSLNAMI